jgi:hypothetical protein
VILPDLHQPVRDKDSGREAALFHHRQGLKSLRALMPETALDGKTADQKSQALD